MEQFEHKAKAFRADCPPRSLGARSKRYCAGVPIFAILLVAMLAPLDNVAAIWVARKIPIAELGAVFKMMKMPGHFGFTLIVAAALAVWHPMRWRAAAFLCFSGIVSGSLGAIIKWAVGRTRPLHNVPPFDLKLFRGGLDGFFHAESLSFPSGHACLAFATAFALTAMIPRLWPLFFAGAPIVAIERVLQGAHYLSDVVAAVGVGCLSVYATSWIWTQISGRTSRMNNDK